MVLWDAAWIVSVPSPLPYCDAGDAAEAKECGRIRKSGAVRPPLTTVATLSVSTNRSYNLVLLHLKAFFIGADFLIDDVDKGIHFTEGHHLHLPFPIQP